MSGSDELGWTLVRHTGWEVARNPQFERAVEERRLTNRSEANRVRKAGGVVVDSYAEAAACAEGENYPPGVEGLIPRAGGQFREDVLIDGCALYIPTFERKRDELTQLANRLGGNE